MYSIKFQTSEFIPPPYANEVQVNLNVLENSLAIDFKLAYINRETIDESDILDEGFTMNDDVSWKGKLGKNWVEEFKRILNKYQISTTNLNETEEKLTFFDGNVSSSPKDKEGLKRFLEQLQQAVFESLEYEKPLFFQLIKISNSIKKTTLLNASFSERKYTQTINSQLIELNWNQLDEHLKLIFAGDFIYEKASNKAPKANGLFMNLGDEWWFEVGKSLKINPSKIDGFLV